MLRLGHRGACGHAPENTLKAIEAGIRAGADVVELDIQRTADGELVVMHDTRVDRTTNGTGSVIDMTLAEIRAHFTEDLLNRRLSTIEEGIGGITRTTAAADRRDELLTLVRAGEPLARLGAVLGDDLSRVNAAAFRNLVGDQAAFYISATPDVLD